jgi:hypothetical protein
MGFFLPSRSLSSIFPHWTWLNHSSFPSNIKMRHVDDFVEFRRNILGFIQAVDDASGPKLAKSPSPAPRSIATIEVDLREHTDFVLKMHSRRETMRAKDICCGKTRLAAVGDNAGSTDENNAQPARTVMCVTSHHDDKYDTLANQRTHSAEPSQGKILSSDHKVSLAFVIHRASDS